MTPDPWIGRTVGRYRIESVAGRGGMGVVYRGVQTSLNRLVAVKVLPPDMAEDRDFVQRFRQEAQAIAGLAHENIVYVFDVEEHEGTTFIVMEFIDGESLAASCGAGPLPPAEVRRIGICVCRALGHAHERGVIHRDVKPANVMLTRDGRVKLTDFGIARVEGGMKTLTGLLPGTPAYMAPEQLKTGQVSPRSDLYSLGVLLFELATGRLPWKGGDPIGSALRRLAEDPPPVRALNPGVPGWLEGVIQRAMARDPEARHSSAAELEHDLLRAGLPVADGIEAAPALEDPTSPTVVPASLRTPPPLPSPGRTTPGRETAPTRAMTSPPALPPDPPPPTEAATVAGGPQTASPSRGLPRWPLLAGAGALAILVGAGLALFLPELPGRRSAGEGARNAAVPAGPSPAAGAASTPAPAAAPDLSAAPDVAPGPGTVTVVELGPTPPAPREAPRPTRPAAAQEPAEPSVPRAAPSPEAASLSAFGLTEPPAVAGTFHCRRGAEFNVSPEEAVVVVDGKPIGTADDWDGKGGGREYVFSRPGAHYVRLELAGYRTAWVKIVVSPTAEDELADVDTELEKDRRKKR